MREVWRKEFMILVAWDSPVLAQEQWIEKIRRFLVHSNTELKHLKVQLLYSKCCTRARCFIMNTEGDL